MANPIGISYPITRGNNGYFNQSFDTRETIKNALTNLILTPKKTRPGRPEYGSSMYGFLFEQIIDDTIIENVLVEDISSWIPSIEVVSIKLKNTDIPNAININLIYKIRNTPISDTLSITVSF
jgi:phage baseplate assembly protein W